MTQRCLKDVGACYPGEASFSSGQTQRGSELHKPATGTVSTPAASGNTLGVAAVSLVALAHSGSSQEKTNAKATEGA